MDKSLPKQVVKHNILSGIIISFYKDIMVIDGCPPILYPRAGYGHIAEAYKAA